MGVSAPIPDPVSTGSVQGVGVFVAAASMVA